MAAPLRIARLSLTHRLDPDDPAKDYVGRLVLLIPGEIIALYQAGRAAIIHQFATPPSDWSPSVISEDGAWIGWTLFCLGALILVRRWATSDPRAGIAPDWKAVALCAVSYLVWVYSLGDVFARVLTVWDPLVAALLALAWTFVAPWLHAPVEA
jgi:hypothetical protein